MGLLIQVLGSGLICSLCMCMGIVFAWPSSTLRLFESKNTTLHRPMTESELALFGSLSSIGALVGTPIVGFLLDRLGRKKSSILFSLFGVLAWGLIAVCNIVEVLLASMFIAGLYGAVFLIVPVFISEICQESIRGAMTSCTIVFYGIGMLVSYLMGGYLEYHVMIYVCLSISAGMTVALTLLKESPTCLMAKGLEEEAAKSIAFYRGLKLDSKEVLSELNMIKRTLNPDMDDAPMENEKLNPEPVDTEKLSFCKFLKKSRSSRRAFFLTMLLISFSIFQGPIILQVYAEPLFEEAIPTMSANSCSILLAVLTTLSGMVAAYLTEKLGRRPLMIYSSFLISLVCLMLGVQLHFHWGPSWLIGVNVYMFMIVYAIGAGGVPYVIMAEVFLPQIAYVIMTVIYHYHNYIKSYVSMIVIEWAWFCNSVVLFIFNPLLKAIGLGPVFYVFAAVGILTAIFCIIFLPETKGLTVDEIQLKLLKRGNRK